MKLWSRVLMVAVVSCTMVLGVDEKPLTEEQRVNAIIVWSMAEAQRRYPALEQPGSEMRKIYDAEWQRAVETNDPAASEPDFEIKLATKIAQRLEKQKAATVVNARPLPSVSPQAAVPSHEEEARRQAGIEIRAWNDAIRLAGSKEAAVALDKNAAFRRYPTLSEPASEMSRAFNEEWRRRSAAGDASVRLPGAWGVIAQVVGEQLEIPVVEMYPQMSDAGSNFRDVYLDECRRLVTIGSPIVKEKGFELKAAFLASERLQRQVIEDNQRWREEVQRRREAVEAADKRIAALEREEDRLLMEEVARAQYQQAAAIERQTAAIEARAEQEKQTAEQARREERQRTDALDTIAREMEYRRLLGY